MNDSPLDFYVREEPVSYGQVDLGNWYPADAYKALVRADTGHLLAIVKDSYTVIQNKDLFGAADEAIDVLYPLGGHVDRVSYDGAWCMREYQTGEYINNLEITFNISHGFGEHAVKCMAGAYDVVCTNGLIIGSAMRLFKPHRGDADKLLEQFDRWIKTASTAVRNFGKVMEIWMKRHNVVTPFRLTDLLDSLELNRTQQEVITDQWIQRPENFSIWGVVCAMTWWATHHNVRQSNVDNRAATVLKRQELVSRWIESDEFAEFTKRCYEVIT